MNLPKFGSFQKHTLAITIDQMMMKYMLALFDGNTSERAGYDSPSTSANRDAAEGLRHQQLLFSLFALLQG